jgi:CRISPR/Cas system-associated exonuclease Cas4 (RecB family)
MTNDNLFRLSHTKIVSFNRCRKQYWFRYVSGLEWPREADTPAAMIGTGVHRAMKVLCETDDPADGEHELDAYLRMPKHEAIGPGTEEHTLAFQLYANGVAAHQSIESEERWAELDTYVPSLKRGINVRTVVDRADRLSAGHWQIIDWKTGRFDLNEEVDAQLDIAHLVLRTIRRLPREARVTAMGWNLRSGQKRVRELVRDDAVATMHYLTGIAARFQATTEFEATPSRACSFCEWRPQCPEAAELSSLEFGDLEMEVEPELLRIGEPF